MTTIAETAVSSPGCSAGLESLLPGHPEQWLCGLAGQLHQSALCAGEDLGHLEEELLRGGHEVFRQMLEKAAQLKADQAPPVCPVCQSKLSRWKAGHGTSIQTRFAYWKPDGTSPASTESEAF